MYGEVFDPASVRASGGVFVAAFAGTEGSPQEGGVFVATERARPGDHRSGLDNDAISRRIGRSIGAPVVLRPGRWWVAEMKGPSSTTCRVAPKRPPDRWKNHCGHVQRTGQIKCATAHGLAAGVTNCSS